MPTAVKVDMNFDLGKIRMDFTKELNRAGDIITKDIVSGIELGGNFGKKWKRNAPSTIAQKGFDKPLYETGTMQYLPKKKMATPQKQEVTIRVADTRDFVGRIHNEGLNPKIPKREWFGISDKAKSEIFTLEEEKIKLEIERA